MPAIYGTPVIFIKKPDTSEQWIINSVVNLEPYTGLGKEKTFDVIFTSNNTSYSRMTLGGGANLVFYGDTLAGSGGNMQEAYRQITLEKPATGELKTWLEANAVRLPLTGTWIFNNVISNTNAPGICNISFTCNGTSYTKIEITATGSIYYGGTGPQYDMKWGDDSDRTITFTEPVQYEGNEEFVRWFVDNATPPSIIEKGTYVFNDGLSSGQWTKGSSVTQRIFAKSNNTYVSSIILLVGAEMTTDGLGGCNIEEISYDLNVGGMTKTTQVYFAYVWTSAAYKTIEITEDCIVDEQFKKWFDYYTTKQ